MRIFGYRPNGLTPRFCPTALQGDRLKKELMEILACPMCKGELELRVETEDGEEVITGALICHKCGETYPIEDAIAHLLPPSMRT